MALAVKPSDLNGIEAVVAGKVRDVGDSPHL